MAQSPGTPSSSTTGQSGHDPSGFGANEWLVEEMAEAYQRDPNSVPAEWRTYFQNAGGSSSNNGSSRNGSATKAEAKAEVKAAPKNESKPEPKAEPEEKPKAESSGDSKPAAKAKPRPAPRRTWTAPSPCRRPPRCARSR